MKKPLSFLFFSLLFSFFSVSAQPIYNLSCTLSGANEAPPNASPATGTLTGTYNQTTKQITLNVPFNGLIGATTVSHIHGPAAAGVNAGVIVPLTIPVGVSSGVIGGTYLLPTAQEAAFLSGNTYINIHTNAFPGGEIRGQIAATLAPSPPAIPTMSEWGLIILAMSIAAVGAWTLLRRT